MNTCYVCGRQFEPAPKIPHQKYCSRSCKNKKYYADKQKTKTPPITDVRIDHPAQNPYVIIDAPIEYIDYIGLEYKALEFEAALHMGALPPGVTVMRTNVRMKVIGQPTPLDFCLRGIGPYNHQAVVKC